MAGITHNGTKNSLPAQQIPTGYTRPTVTEVDGKYVYRVVLDILKVTVDESTAVASMEGIIDNGSIGIDKQVLDIVAEDYLDTRTVTVWTDWIALKTNMSPILADDEFLTDAVTNYECTIDIHILTAAG